MTNIEEQLILKRIDNLERHEKEISDAINNIEDRLCKIESLIKYHENSSIFRFF